MKKNVKKLRISRETLHALDLIHGVAGGSTHPTVAPGCQDPTVYGGGCQTGTGSYGQCSPSYNCSTGCQTGGNACTALTCGC